MATRYQAYEPQMMTGGGPGMPGALILPVMLIFGLGLALLTLLQGRIIILPAPVAPPAGFGGGDPSVLDDNPQPNAGPLVSGPFGVINSPADIRTGPGTAYPAVRAALYGERLALIGRDAARAWYAVAVPEAPNGLGWIAAGQLSVFQADALPEVQPGPSPAATPATVDPAGPFLMVSAVETPVYAGPGADYEPLRWAAPGERLALVGHSGDGAWWAVESAGATGWVSSAAATVFNAAGLPALPRPGLKPVVLPVAAGLVAVAPDTAVALRRGPGLEFGVIRRAAAGESWVVAGRSLDGAWWAISLPGAPDNRGWIEGRAATVHDAAGRPVHPPTGLASAIAPVLDGLTAVVVGPPTAGPDAAVRSGPGHEFAAIRQAAVGERLEVLGRSTDGAWWVVALPGSPSGFGWIGEAGVSVTGG